MYSLFVSHEIDVQGVSTTEMSTSRFLEYTSDAISTQLTSLSNEAIDCIKSWPCILMREGRGDESAYVVQISEIRLEAGNIKVNVQPVPANKQLINDEIWKLRVDLDIEQFEFNRNHWAFKDRDLFTILHRGGYVFDPAYLSRFAFNKLPAPTRRDLLAARNVMSEWGHTEIDDFLLEAGVHRLDATRTRGSRRDRANAIIEYAIANPAATTAENSLFSAFIVRAASSRDHSGSAPLEPGGAVTVIEESSTVRDQEESNSRMPNRVFIVHGQNETARTAVMSVLTRIGLVGIVLHEQPNMGRHLLTKFIEEAELVTFAIVLMTDDDVGSLRGGSLAPRARQNVILELGYFLSHLGQKNVCALITPDLETPSDFDGIVYIRMDAARTWEAELIRELRAAGMPIVE